MYQGSIAYYSSQYPYYFDGGNCQSFSESNNWIEFELTNNSSTFIGYQFVHGLHTVGY